MAAIKVNRKAVNIEFRGEKVTTTFEIPGSERMFNKSRIVIPSEAKELMGFLL
jgi:hypothetical protein